MKRDDAYHHPMRHDGHLYKGVLQLLGAIRPKGIRANTRRLPELHGLAQRGEQAINVSEQSNRRLKVAHFGRNVHCFATVLCKTCRELCRIRFRFADLLKIVRNSLPKCS